MKQNKIALLITALLIFAMACLCTDTSAIPTAQPPTGNQPASSSGIIDGVTMATDTQGDNKDPVGPTTVFTTSSVIHAVASIVDAAANTAFTAEFYVVDVGSAAPANSLITSVDVTADGTRNIDFTLTPNQDWPVGSYRVDILVNGKLDQSVSYTVQ